MKTLILGGVRSGKTRQAEALAESTDKPVIYIATALALDDEMHARIARHRTDRSPAWRTVEEPYALATALRKHTAPDCCVVVDCLTLWMTQLLCAESTRLSPERDALVEAYSQIAGDVILVSNETSLGVMPVDALSRRFCDEMGWLHQRLAKDSDRVLFMTAGLSMSLKGNFT